MGKVFMAQHTFMGRKAAVKVLHTDLARNEPLVHRFLNEAKAANAIRHPNIIDIIDAGILPEDKTPYLLMEFLEGESLASRIKRLKVLDVADAIEIARQTASALAAAHGQGIIHRDLKPDNLYLVPDSLMPHGERVKVLDFGIAKLRGTLRGDSEKTVSGAILGTPVYMSPEQCQGLVEEIDHHTDVYALGVILFEMVCGAAPFVNKSFTQLLLAHVNQPPRPPKEINPNIPDVLEATILRALAKAPTDRFPSMLSFQAALDGATDMAGEPGESVMTLTPPVPFQIPDYSEQSLPTQESISTFRKSAGETLPTERRTGHGKTVLTIALPVLAVAVVLGFFATRPSKPKPRTARPSAGVSLPIIETQEIPPAPEPFRDRITLPDIPETAEDPQPLTENQDIKPNSQVPLKFRGRRGRRPPSSPPQAQSPVMTKTTQTPHTPPSAPTEDGSPKVTDKW